MIPGRDEVLRMAREAAERGNWKPGLGNADVADFMERFAALVADHAAAAERKKSAEICKTLAGEARQQFHVFLEDGDEQSAVCNAASAQVADFLADMVLANGDPKSMAEAFRKMEKKAFGGDL